MASGSVVWSRVFGDAPGFAREFPQRDGAPIGAWMLQCSRHADDCLVQVLALPRRASADGAGDGRDVASRVGSSSSSAPSSLRGSSLLDVPSTLESLAPASYGGPAGALYEAKLDAAGCEALAKRSSWAKHVEDFTEAVLGAMSGAAPTPAAGHGAASRSGRSAAPAPLDDAQLVAPDDYTSGAGAARVVRRSSSSLSAGLRGSSRLDDSIFSDASGLGAPLPRELHVRVHYGGDAMMHKIAMLPVALVASDIPPAAITMMQRQAECEWRILLASPGAAVMEQTTLRWCFARAPTACSLPVRCLSHACSAHVLQGQYAPRVCGRGWRRAPRPWNASQFSSQGWGGRGCRFSAGRRCCCRRR